MVVHRGGLTTPPSGYTGAVTAAKTIYYDHTRPAHEQPEFPTGEAGPVVVRARGEVVGETTVWISPNARCALVYHGAAAALASLPGWQGVVGNGTVAVVGPGGAEAVAEIFYEADRKTYGGQWDALARERVGPARIHYRIAIDNREYQRTLSQLQFMAMTAARSGHGLRLRL